MPHTLAENQFGKTARLYAASPGHANSESLSRLAEVCDLQPDWRALDVATGAGHTAATLAPRVAEVIALDLTNEMLSQTRALARKRGLANIETVRASAMALPCADESFDIVTCRLAAHHFPDIAKFVSEAARVLKPGGLLAIVDNVPPDRTQFPDCTDSEIAAMEQSYHDFEQQRDPSHEHAWPVARWSSTLAEHDLTVLHTERLKKEMAFTPWVARMHCPPETIVELRQRLNDDRGLKTFLTPRRHNDDIWFSLTEMIITARKVRV